MSDSADHARQLAGLFSQMAQTVDDYRTQHFAELSLQDRVRLEGVIQQLEDVHDRFTAIAIDDTLKAIEGDLNEITGVTTQAKDVLKRLKTVQEIVTVVSAAAELAGDITTGDYGDIPQAIKTLTITVAEGPDQPPAKPGKATDSDQEDSSDAR